MLAGDISEPMQSANIMTNGVQDKFVLYYVMFLVIMDIFALLSTVFRTLTNGKLADKQTDRKT